MTTLNEKARAYAIEYLHGTTNEKEFMDNEHLLPFKDAVKAIDIALTERYEVKHLTTQTVAPTMTII